MCVFTCFCREDPEAVVPKATGDKEPAVHCGDEAVGSDPDFLAEVVAEMPLQSRT